MFHLLQIIVHILRLVPSSVQLSLDYKFYVSSQGQNITNSGSQLLQSERRLTLNRVRVVTDGLGLECVWGII